MEWRKRLVEAVIHGPQGRWFNPGFQLYVEVPLGEMLDPPTAHSHPQLSSDGPSRVDIGEGCVRKGIRRKNCQINVQTMIHCGDTELTG
ncbi:hypothetical protein EXN66_Car020571 [Channa argus]|uniref:Uncharacterized protein n=1 Tax=Channa argus TaxID=215402 RepID=A0A6G1QQC3_CHAAH|nr:hypothetical protein EXN66_Car020571 [Channa argus]